MTTVIKLRMFYHVYTMIDAQVNSKSCLVMSFRTGSDISPQPVGSLGLPWAPGGSLVSLGLEKVEAELQKVIEEVRSQALRL